MCVYRWIDVTLLSYQANLDEQQASSNTFVRALMTSVCQAAIICESCNKSFFSSLISNAHKPPDCYKFCIFKHLSLSLSSCKQARPHIKWTRKSFPRGPSCSSATLRTSRRSCRRSTRYRASWFRWSSRRVSVSLYSLRKCTQHLMGVA